MGDYLTDWKFSTSKTNFQCYAIPYNCDPPLHACAFDLQTARSFCCNYESFCWNDIAPCASDESSFTCERGSASWCCMKGREQCHPGRNHACISTVKNIFRDLNARTLNDTYSSLSAAQPPATYLSFDLVRLIAATSTLSTSPTSSIYSSTPTITETTTMTTPLSSSTSIASKDSNNLTAGSIAGIVVGVIARATIIIIGVWYVMKKKRRERIGPSVGTNDKTGVHEAPASTSVSEVPANAILSELHGIAVMSELPPSRAH